MKNQIAYKSENEKIWLNEGKKSGYIKDFGSGLYILDEKKRREFGTHLTSVDIFKEFMMILF